MRSFVETVTDGRSIPLRNRALVVLSWMAVLTGGGVEVCSGAPAVEVPKRVTITRQMLPERDPSGTPATFSYEAINYKPRLEISQGDKEAFDMSTPEKGLRTYMTANWEGNATNILKVFAPADREKLQKLVSDKDILEKNTMIFKNINTVIVVQQVFYGNYRILMGLNVTATGSRRIQHYVFKYTADGWCLTNDLGEDRFFPKLVEVMKPDPASIKVETK